jgi:hypothetical protein
VGLFPCEAGGRDVFELDPARPVTLLVHGCNSSGERFKTLAQVFEANHQQAICFSYNDRDFLNTSATQLAAAITALQQRLQPGELTILGHSQGGLIARRALQADLPRPLVTRAGFTFRLVTVSAPFGGIASSADCGRVWLHVLSLSATVVACLAITGNKWVEIPPGSAFMTNQAPVATRHLQIVSDERGSCRVQRPDGSCATSDFVFGLAEQSSPRLAADPLVTVVTLRAGHAAIVGENGVPPLQLLEALQRHGVLASTPPSRPDTAAALLRRLYGRSI